MKILLNHLIKKHRLAANTAETIVAANAQDGEAVFTVLDGGTFFIPYGEYDHRQGLQIFDREAAENLLANHQGILSKMKRLVTGGSYPVYIGHPDIPGSTDTDKRAYAWIEKMVVENDGLRLIPRWTPSGEEMIEGGHFRFYSPTWYLGPRVGKGHRPVALKSLGLTNNPNIPVPALSNEDDQPQTTTETEMNLKDILAALGLDENADLQTVLDAIADLKKAATPVEDTAAENMDDDPAQATNAEITRLTDAGMTLPEIAAEVPATQAELQAIIDGENTEPGGELIEALRGIETPDTEETEEAENELQAVRAQVVQFRDALIDRELDLAENDGRITRAQRAGERKQLLAANDLNASLQNLRKRKPSIKTTSKVGDLGRDKSKLVAANQSQAAAEERRQLVANELDRTNTELPMTERKKIAWQRAAAKNPDLFNPQKSTPANA